MSTMEHTAGYGSAGAHGHHEAESHGGHPTARTYVLIGVFLTIITVVEVVIYGIDAIRPMLALVLTILSAAKFVTVVGFFMHLKFDHPLFRYMFGFGLLVAISIVTALSILFAQNPLPHTEPAAPAH